MKNFYLLIVFLIFFAMQGQEATTTIYLIRHAEKADNSADPGLSEAGKERVQKWVSYFKGKDVEYNYYTPAKRSLDTAIPIATALEFVPNITTNRQFEIYEGSNISLKEIAEKHKGKNMLVVGHSNTIPMIINTMLGKNTYKDIPEDEYGNLYIITITGDKITHQLVKI